MEAVTPLLDFYSAPMEWLLSLPGWGGYLLLGCLMAARMGLAGWVLAKSGRSPLWVCLVLAPYLDVLAIWTYAYSRWPSFEDLDANRSD